MRFIRQTANILMADVVMEGGHLVLKTAIAAIIGPALFGVVVLIQLIPQYAEKFFRLGVDEGSIYLASRNSERVGVVFFNTALLTFFFGLFSIVAFFLLKDLYAKLLIKEINISLPTLLAVLASIPPIFLFRAFMKSMMYIENIKMYNIINFGTPLLGQIFMLAVVLLMGDRLFYIILSPTVAYMIGSFFGGVVLYKEKKLTLRWDSDLQKQLLRYGLKVYLPAVIQFMHFRIDVLIIGALLSPKEVGFYTLAATFAQILYKLPTTVSSLLYPKAARQKTIAKAQDLAVRTFRHLIIAMVTSIIPLWIVVEVVIHYFMGAYQAVLPSFRILIVAWATIGMAQILHNYFLSEGSPHVSAKIFTVSLIMNIIFNFAFIPSLGIVGASFASLISYAVCTVIFVVVFLSGAAIKWQLMLVPQRNDLETYKQFYRHLYTTFFAGKVGENKGTCIEKVI